MTFLFQAIIMGIVEGITEFLPISSTGHLIIVGNLIDFVGKFSVLFEIVIQLGAILAVVYLYREKIFNSIKNLSPNKWGFKLWLGIFIAFLPSAVVGILLNDYIKKYLFSTYTVAIALIIGAILILLIEKFSKVRKTANIEELNLKSCLFIGIVQCLSLFPGMSRSACTIMGGLIVGLSASVAAEFSFFLAIPTMFAASGYSLIKHTEHISGMEAMGLVVGFITSFFVALLVVRKFVQFLGRHKLAGFAYYRLIIGIVLLILIAQNVIR